MAFHNGELDDEIRSHIEHETQLNIDRGIYQSRAAIFHALFQDARYPLRNLRRTPQFSSVIAPLRSSAAVDPVETLRCD